ncbi:hypothetical protein [Armatimonas sp.]|uniref:hypothetical protein n=1 Tax=Armatimonas sp. TaxID=1872638 RepID=UPI0037522EFA
MEKKSAWVEIKIKAGVWIDPLRLVKAIAEAGYQARRDDILLTLTGTLVREKGGYLLQMSDVKPEPQVLFVQRDSVVLEDLVGVPVEVEGFYGTQKAGVPMTLRLLKIQKL